MLRQCCCCCCIIVVILGALSVTAWFVIRQFSPSKSAVYEVSNASLTLFNMTTTNTTLQYDLALNMTVENPNKWNNFHYEKFESAASYKNQDMSNSILSTFTVGHKNSYVVTPSFKGQRPVTLSKEEVSSFRNTTVFDIALKVYIKYWTKIGAIKFDKELQVACYFKVPLSRSGKPAEKFESTKCDKA